MRSWRSLALAVILGLSFSAPALAIQKLSKQNDGSLLFRCEYKGSAYKVQVKDLGKGQYMVLRKGRGTTGFSGKVSAANPESAARFGCGED